MQLSQNMTTKTTNKQATVNKVFSIVGSLPGNAACDIPQPFCMYRWLHTFSFPSALSVRSCRLSSWALSAATSPMTLPSRTTGRGEEEERRRELQPESSQERPAGGEGGYHLRSRLRPVSKKDKRSWTKNEGSHFYFWALTLRLLRLQLSSTKLRRYNH